MQKAESTPNLSRSFTEAVLHTTGNTASILRSRCNREKVEIYEKSELLEKRKQLDSEMRQMEMRKNHPAWQKLRFSTQVVDHGIEAKKSQWKQTADERELDYKMELQKMKIRVESQPTLFERQSQVCHTVIKSQIVSKKSIFGKNNRIVNLNFCAKNE